MTQNIDKKEKKLYSGAEIFVKCLEAEGIDLVFGYPGGAVLHIYDELHKQNEVTHILVRHEQGASFAGEAALRDAAAACPGSGRVIEFFASAEPTQVRKADGNGIDNDMYLGTSSASPGRDWYVPNQCGEGYVGMACKSCAEDWHAQDSVCQKCPQDQALSVAVLLIVGAVLFVALIGLYAKWSFGLGSKSGLERKLETMLNQAASVDGLKSVVLAFSEADVDGDGGINVEEFATFLARAGVINRDEKGSKHASIGAKDVQKLFARIDTDQSGTVNIKEFAEFAMSISQGRRVSAMAQNVVALRKWWRSRLTGGIRTILLSYAQILASLEINFPELYTQKEEQKIPKEDYGG